MSARSGIDAAERAGISRRGLLKSGAALVIGFALPLAPRRTAAAPGDGRFDAIAWLRIGTDDRVTVLCGSAEMGQGVLTAIPMLVAEELDADWSKVAVEQAPTDKAYANPMFGVQATGGSTTVRAHWEPLRRAGAAARQMLVSAAAARWQVDAAQCRTEAGAVIHPDGRQRLNYGSLAGAASKLPVPEAPPLKEKADFRILGQPLKRLDTPAKIDGSAMFGIDAQLPGMLVAVMARAPLPGAKPARVDDTKARAVRGVEQIITIEHGVAVLANGFWAAKQGRDALQIDWDLGGRSGLDDARVHAMLSEGADAGGILARNDGDVGAARTAHTVESQYGSPYLAHACMEPLNCTAWLNGDALDVHVGTQAQGPLQGALAQIAGVAPEKVQVHEMLLGGGFGRRFAMDFAIDATLLSKLSGKPVKLMFTREDDTRAGFFRPVSIGRFSAGTDAAGRPVSLRATLASPSIVAGSGFLKLGEDGIDDQAVEGVKDMPYDIPNVQVRWARVEPGPQVWFWRSVGHSQNIFYMESFIDELAAAAKADPFEYRRALLSKQPRYKGVLELAANKAGWGRPLPAGVFRGIAVAQSFGSYVAEVAEVSVQEDGTARVHRVVAAVDCGSIVNPAIIRRQIEGGIVYGLTAALYGRLSLRDGSIQEGNFHDYPLLRMNEMPKVEVHILDSSEKPGGIGEPGTPPIAPALTNALFAATGKRIRTLPVDPALLRKA
ncbi:MAG: molybdopterin cofactor-binding domain-containing protein [Gammaproteobacteria bacterium]